MKILPSLSCIILFAGIAYSQNSNSCGDLLKIQSSRLPNSNTVLTSTTANAARPAQGNVTASSEHCEMLNRINERTGANGQKYAINFHLRLPATWNGNFFFEGEVRRMVTLGMRLETCRDNSAVMRSPLVMQWCLRIQGMTIARIMIRSVTGPLRLVLTRRRESISATTPTIR